MTTPFDQIAPSYAELWSDTPNGRSQREQVWREIDGLFRPGDRVLDLGCGAGDDALHLAARGVEVVGIDASTRMVDVACSRGVDARVLAVEDLAGAMWGRRSRRLPSALVDAPEGRRQDRLPHLLERGFSGIVSNFGVLNCIEDLRGVSHALANLLEPGSPLAICVMGRFRWREPRRWPGRAHWRGMTVLYRSSRELEGSFAQEFRLLRRTSIGGGDHTLFVFERKP